MSYLMVWCASEFRREETKGREIWSGFWASRRGSLSMVDWVRVAQTRLRKTEPVTGNERKSEAMIRRAIVLFPKLAQIECIQQIRQAYDPLASLIPPHITLVFPFESAISTEDLSVHMSSVARQFHPFPLSLQGITGHTNEYLFLNVKEGNDRLIALHDQLYTGVLAPYLTVQETYFPHLTIGRLSNTSTFAEALSQVQSMIFSFETEVHEVSAYRIEPDGNWQVECKANLS